MGGEQHYCLAAARVLVLVICPTLDGWYAVDIYRVTLRLLAVCERKKSRAFFLTCRTTLYSVLFLISFCATVVVLGFELQV